MLKRAILIVLVVALAACGDDSGGGAGGGLSEEEQAYVDEAMADFDPEDAEPLTEDDARCMVTSLVEEVGVDRLEEIGLSAESFATDEDLPTNLEEDDAQQVIDSMNGCFDLRELFLAGMAEGEELPAEARACLSDAMDDEFVDQVMLTMLTEGEAALEEDPELRSELMSLFTECPEAMG